MMVLFAGLGVAGTLAAAWAYRMREHARLRVLSESARAFPDGGAVRYRSTDRQGRATAEWELVIPPGKSAADNAAIDGDPDDRARR